VAFGAEANNSTADDPQIAKWFKLHLNRQAAASQGTFDIPPLPNNVTLTQVYTAYMKYLYDHAKSFFISSSVDGQRIWNKLGNNAVIVLATPNSWDVVEQGFLKEAAIAAGLFPGTFSQSRLLFVTEGEASVHHVLHHASGPGWLRPGVVFAVLDAGGLSDVTVFLFNY